MLAMAHTTVPPLATALNRVPAVQLNYDRAGRGEPLVLIHGIGSRWQVWELERACRRVSVDRLVYVGALVPFFVSHQQPAHIGAVARSGSARNSEIAVGEVANLAS